jgi:hypothetical protein
MDTRKPAHRKDDIPIIGDYSDAAKPRPRVASQEAPSPRPAPRAANPAGAQQWRLDPSDVRRHARLARQREGRGLGRFLRYAFLAIGLVAVGAVYWNFETLRAVTVDFSALASLFADDSGAAGGGTRLFGGEPETAVVEAAGVVGAAAPTSIGDPPPAAETNVAEASSGASPAAEQAPATRAELPAVETAPAPVAAPEPPAGPETFDFGLSVLNVSEADASAAVIILRNGGSRAPSSVTWWTRDGTATAGVDYANLGMVVVQFAAGEQNRTIHIPIVGDRNVEGPETFYVTLAASESAAAAAEPLQQLEVVINDDD